MHPPLIPVWSAAESAAADAATIAAGVPSRALMQRAGAAAASEIVRRYHDRLHAGVVVHAGRGNNGGDAWVVARALAVAGVPCSVQAWGEPSTDDCRAERALAEQVLAHSLRVDGSGGGGVVVDGLLGTGARGEPRGEVARAIGEIASARAAGAVVVALDTPSGVDATTGVARGAVHADLTLTFGAMKRGLLVARETAGAVAVLEIGLLTVPGDVRQGSSPTGDLGAAAPRLVSARWVRSVLPPIPVDAHKGARRKLALVGGQRGMAGACVLAARAANATGIGMVRLLLDPASVVPAQAAAPEAMATDWLLDDEALDRDILGWADVIALGPGMGHDAEARALVERILRGRRGPVLLDADALNVFAGRVEELAELLAGRPALLTPHVGEFSRLAGVPVEEVLSGRFDVAAPLAATLGATILLKGVPTVVVAPDGRRLVSASGTPALAAAGSGDLLSGVAATLLAQVGDPLVAGAAAAWAHGRAAELAGARIADAVASDRHQHSGGVRGVTLADVVDALPAVWHEAPTVPLLPVLAELPAP